MNAKQPQIGIIMGSDSDLEVMKPAAEMLEAFDVPHEVRIVSAHRTPQWMSQYAREARGRGLKVIIAGAGGSAHLPGMTASETTLPVIAVPVQKPGQGDEARKSSTAMPRGIPLAVVPNNGADRAALLAIRILSLENETLAKKYEEFVKELETDSRAKDQQLLEEGWRGLLGS